MSSLNNINLKGFQVALKNFSEKEIPAKVVQMQKWIAFEVFKRILEKTPVDKGFLRGSWTVALNAPEFQQGKTDAKDGEAVTAAEQGKLSGKMTGLKMGDTIYFLNRMPYVLVVEFGGYPNPPVRGTYLRKGQNKGAFTGPGWFKFSAGGFSLQAPRGMVAVSIAEVKDFIQGKSAPDVEVS